jgi:hypothetical protein
MMRVLFQHWNGEKRSAGKAFRWLSMQSRFLLGGRPGRRSPRLFFASGPGLCFGLVY